MTDVLTVKEITTDAEFSPYFRCVDSVYRAVKRGLVGYRPSGQLMFRRDDVRDYIAGSSTAPVRAPRKWVGKVLLAD